MENMFNGNYTAKVDSNGRFTFPSKQLSQIGDNRQMYIMLSLSSPSLWLMPIVYWQEFSSFIMKNKFPFATQEMALRRQFIGNSFETEIDNNSRVVIPQHLSDKVQITDKCIIVGVGDFFEIWDPDTFIAQESEEQKVRQKAVRELGGPTKL